MHAPLDLALRAEWRPLSGMEAITTEWRSLAERAIEPNIFYEPGFALAAAPVLGQDAGAVLVWATSGRLLGFFPAWIERRYGLLPRVLMGWVHPYAPLGLPLVDRDDAEKVIAAWLDHLAQDKSLPAVALVPFLPQEGAFAEAFERVIAPRGTAVAHFGVHERAFFEPGEIRQDYIQHAVSAKTRKELNRKRRRLEESGALTREAVTSPFAIRAAMAEFFALEASGWKGRAGTAAAQSEDIKGFVEQAVCALAAEGKTRADLVRIDGKLVAATLVLMSQDTAWGWKIAYDEAYARFSPAVQLVYDLTQVLLGNPQIMRGDSCATPDHPMIDHLWRERLPLSDCMIALRPGPAFTAARRLEAARRRAIALAKRARDTWRRKSVRPARAASAG
jgi:CelD/BcsL family acetyltransferase involved in cellulose biosynthesis